MTQTKKIILENLCYTDLVYSRINKKLGSHLSKFQIENLIFNAIKETEDKFFSKKGKNYYITNVPKNFRITINSYTNRVITVDRL